MAWRDVVVNRNSWERSTPKSFMVKKHIQLGTQTLNDCCKKCKGRVAIPDGVSYEEYKNFFDDKGNRIKDKSIKRFEFDCTMETIEEIGEEKIIIRCTFCGAKQTLKYRADFYAMGGKITRQEKE